MLSRYQNKYPFHLHHRGSLLSKRPYPITATLDDHWNVVRKSMSKCPICCQCYQCSFIVAEFPEREIEKRPNGGIQRVRTWKAKRKTCTRLLTEGSQCSLVCSTGGPAQRPHDTSRKGGSRRQAEREAEGGGKSPIQKTKIRLPCFLWCSSSANSFLKSGFHSATGQRETFFMWELFGCQFFPFKAKCWNLTLQQSQLCAYKKVKVSLCT